MSTGAWILVVAVAAALAFGGYRALSDGRFRGTRRVRGLAGGARGRRARGRGDSLVAGTPWSDRLGERATLLQFSSAFCAPCRATRRTLEQVASSTDGVAHLEVDAEQHLDVVRRLGILRTPTTIVLDARGREVSRAAGAPTPQQVYAALGQAVEATD